MADVTHILSDIENGAVPEFKQLAAIFLILRSTTSLIPRKARYSIATFTRDNTS